MNKDLIPFHISNNKPVSVVLRLVRIDFCFIQSLTTFLSELGVQFAIDKLYVKVNFVAAMSSKEAIFRYYECF